ncbi:putative protein LOL1-like [Capsicum annuum]|nr:putative protein LOL1-like [Capsicum annuum]
MREKNRAHRRPLNCQMGSSQQFQNGVFDANGWGYCKEEQLENILLTNLDYMYNWAIAKLVSLGYDEEVAMKAILRNGYSYGDVDVLTDLLHNSLSYLSNENVEDTEHSFADLRQLEECLLAGMVCLLEQVNPHLSKGDAMWYLLRSDLHVGRACMIEIPVRPPQHGNGSASVPVSSTSNVVGVSGMEGLTSGSLQREIECPEKFNLTPSMKDLLKRNVSAFAAGLRANSKYVQNQSQACPTSLSGGDLPSGSTSVFEGGLVQSSKSQNLENQDVVSSLLTKFHNLNLDENSEQLAQKDEMILKLIRQIKDLERQAKEKKVWAHQKAMQAARKLSNDLTELKMLRMKREETQRLKKDKQVISNTTTNSLAHMGTALREAIDQAHCANLTIKKLENEYTETSAELEAYKLSASESAATCLERKISDLKQQFVELEAAQKEAEFQSAVAANLRSSASLEKYLREPLLFFCFSYSPSFFRHFFALVTTSKKVVWSSGHGPASNSHQDSNHGTYFRQS